MEKGLEFLEWPVAARPTLVALALIFALLFVSAILIEFLRERRARRNRVKREWETVQEIVKEKGLSDREWRLVETIIREHSPTSPIQVVTVRRHFNRCVAAYMDSLRQIGNESKYAETGLQLRDLRVRFALDFVPFNQHLETTRELSQGQTVLGSKTGEGSFRWFRMTVVSVDEAYLHLAVDHTKREEPPPALRVGDELRCRLWREDDARYAFTATVSHLEETPPRVLAWHTATLKRIQARAYYRVRLNQSTIVGLVDAPTDGNYEDVRARPVTARMRGKVVDLSAGGLAIELPQNAPPRVLVRVTLDLPESEPLTVDARIVDTMPRPGGQCLVRSAFVAIDEETRDAIAHYVWLRQQPLLRREDGEQASL